MLMPKNQQKQAIQAKREKILAWLKQEGFSTAPILGQVLGFGRPGTHKTLKDMERDELIAPAEIDAGAGSLTVWGLTPHGAAMAVDPGEADPDWSYFEPGRVSPLSVGHGLAVQRVRLHLEAHGWTGWQSDRQLHKLQLKKCPDGMARDPAGQIVAVEVERTIKTEKRYQGILAEYLQMARTGEVDRVAYYCPRPGMAERLKRMILGIEYVVIRGERIPLKAEHYQKFEFVDFSTVKGEQ